MALTRSLPYLACHFRVSWSGNDPPAGDGGFSEVLLPPLAAGSVRVADGPVTGGAPPGLGGAVGASAAPGIGAAAGASPGALPGAATGVAAPGGGTGGATAGADGGDNAARLVLRRGFTGSLELYRWCLDARAGREDHVRTVCVELLDGETGRVVCSWEFARARPQQLDYAPLRALDSGVLIETLSLSFERMTMK